MPELEFNKIHRQAFERALWAGAAGPEGWPLHEGLSNKKLNRAMADAWRGGDVQQTAALGRILWRRSRLDDIAAARLRLTLLRLGSFAEALELTERRAAPASDARGAYDRAWALAAMDQRDLAAQTLAQARARGLGPGQADPLGEILASETDPAGLEDWARARGVIETALWLGLANAAVRQLAAELAPSAFGLGLDPEQTGQALALARVTLRGCGAAEAALLLDATEPLFADGEDRAAYHAVSEALAGSPEALDDSRPRPVEPERLAQRHLLALVCAAAGRRPSAVEQLGRLCEGLAPPGEMHLDLARLIGQETLERTPLQLNAPAGPRRIFDVFPFDGEVTALEIKLHETAGCGDRFVLVEARSAPDGRGMPPRFEPQQARFAAFADKIVHVQVDEIPAHIQTPTARAIYLRDQGVRGLTGLCAPQDLVLLTDPGEVLDGRKIAAFEGPYGACEVETFAYFLNLRRADTPPPRPAAAVLEGRFLAGSGMSYARLGLQAWSRSRVARGGWRFCSIPDPAGEGEDAALIAAIRAGSRPAGFEHAPLDESFPRYVRERSGELAALILG